MNDPKAQDEKAPASETKIDERELDQIADSMLDDVAGGGAGYGGTNSYGG